MTAEQRVTDYYHHVADRCGRALRVGEAVSAVQEVVRGKILDEIHEQALDSEREQNTPGNVLLWILRLFSQRGDGFESHQQQNRNRHLEHHGVETVRHDYG